MDPGKNLVCEKLLAELPQYPRAMSACMNTVSHHSFKIHFARLHGIRAEEFC